MPSEAKLPKGQLALVGSGEYTAAMTDIEAELIEAGMRFGKREGFIQFATAAGQESKSSIEYWRELGREQAERIGVKCKFIPVLNRADAMNTGYLDSIRGASLIYFSGGDPIHLAKSLHGTPLLKTIKEEFISGSSLAGCSAGAMAMSSETAIHWRKNKEHHTGFEILPNTQILPHYDRYFSRIPMPIQNLITGAEKSHKTIGIDEDTAVIWSGGNWQVKGRSKVHLLNPKLEVAKSGYVSREKIDWLENPLPDYN